MAIIAPCFMNMNYGLPDSVNIGGEAFAIRTDFRVILEILEAMNDPELDEAERAEVMLRLFYPDCESLTDVAGALRACVEFIDMGAQDKTKSPRLVDFEHDFEYIIAPVNRVLGTEARAIRYDFETNSGGLHWWSFMSAYMEIGGDCLMSQIVRIRDKLTRGKALEKYERQWYRRNRDLVQLQRKYTQAEDDLVKQWTKGGCDDGGR